MRRARAGNPMMEMDSVLAMRAAVSMMTGDEEAFQALRLTLLLAAAPFVLSSLIIIAG
jgi:hypothetical protein